jgi:hypothetical protein
MQHLNNTFKELSQYFQVKVTDELSASLNNNLLEFMNQFLEASSSYEDEMDNRDFDELLNDFVHAHYQPILYTLVGNKIPNEFKDDPINYFVSIQLNKAKFKKSVSNSKAKESLSNMVFSSLRYTLLEEIAGYRYEYEESDPEIVFAVRECTYKKANNNRKVLSFI